MGKIIQMRQKGESIEVDAVRLYRRKICKLINGTQEEEKLEIIYRFILKYLS